MGDTPGQHTHIVTISKVGYRLVAQVSDDTKAEAVLSPAAQKVETKPLSLNRRIKEFEHIAGGSKFSVWRLASILTVTLSLFIIGFWALSNFKTNETLSVQARLDKGFSEIQNFAVKNSIEEAQSIFNGVLSENPDNTAARAGLAFSLFREYTHLKRDPEVLNRAKSHAETAFRQDEHLALSNIAAAWRSEFDGDFDRAREFLDLPKF